jgi:hypothetical protein
VALKATPLSPPAVRKSGRVGRTKVRWSASAQGALRPTRALPADRPWRGAMTVQVVIRTPYDVRAFCPDSILYSQLELRCWPFGLCGFNVRASSNCHFRIVSGKRPNRIGSCACQQAVMTCGVVLSSRDLVGAVSSRPAKVPLPEAPKIRMLAWRSLVFHSGRYRYRNNVTTSQLGV